MIHPTPCLTLTALTTAVTLAAALPALAENAGGPLSPDAVKARIQQHRTADVTLTVLGADGKPLANTAVTVRQVRHQFLFGCNAFMINTADTSEVQKAYQDRFSALLNYATLPFYWGAFERQEGEPGTARVKMMAEWCASRGILTKGHPLCWHEVPCKWLFGRPLDDVQRLQLGRITREVTDFRGLIGRWDVVNEAVRMPTYDPDKNPIGGLCRKLGAVELIRQTFVAARAADPKATLILNDYETSENYAKLIQGCLDAGAPIDIIGIQSHMHGGYWGARKAWETCERFAKFGKPLHFTELTIISAEKHPKMDWRSTLPDWNTTPEGEKRQAEQGAEFYRTLFSHPAVQGITWWDFSDRGSWMGAPSGLVRKDMSPKPLYEALMKMVRGEWWTGPQALATDNAGQVRFRAFLGDYAVEAAGKGTSRFTVAAPGTATASATLTPTR
jgi:GH35 family endo-1,4-beta-xylanase